MVRRELHLPSFGRPLQLGQRHDAGVVDEHVKRPVPRVHEAGDRGSIGQLEWQNPRRRQARARGNFGRDPFARMRVTHRKCDDRADRSQRALDVDGQRFDVAGCLG